MPVVLSVSRAAVPAEHEAEYLATLRSLAKVLKSRGQRLWVFKHPARRARISSAVKGAMPAGTA